jgi:DNA polymerase III epsilon subunit family exonuclease
VPGSITPPPDGSLSRLSHAATCVALDLETTGLQVESESIIEVAAVKFRNAQVLDTFQTLVSPGRPIPYRIQRLTGLTDASLAGAPTFPDLIDTLRRLIGDWPLVGHSIAFDVSFLRRYGLARTNPLLDTFELANVLLPALPSYSLESVAAALAVPGTTYHRAMADAVLAKEVYLALLERLAQAETSAIQEVAALGARHTWPLLELFRQELSRRGIKGSRREENTIGAQLAGKLGVEAAVFDLPVASAAPGDGRPGRRTARPTTHMTPDDAAGNGMSQVGASPSATPMAAASQAEVASRVRSTLEERSQLLLEVGAHAEGLLATLTAALRWAAASHESLVIASGTIASCRRLAREVLPAVQATLGTMLAVEIADDPENYLCLHRWLGVARDRRNGELPADIARGLAKVTFWLHDTQIGRRDEVVLMPQEAGVWEQVRAGDEHHGMFARCPYRARGFCFIEQGRQRVRQAQIVLTTHHALLKSLTSLSRFPRSLSDVPASERIISDPSHVLLLDAHLLEEETFQETAFAISNALLQETIAAIGATAPNGRRSGLLHLLEETIQQEPRTSEKVQREFASKRSGWLRDLAGAGQAAPHFFGALDALIADARAGSGGARGRGGESHDAAMRLTNRVRSSGAWEQVQDAWQTLHEALQRSANVAREAAALCDQVGATAMRPARAYALAGELLGIREQLLLIAARGLEVVRQPAADRVYWLKPAPLPPAHAAPAPLRSSRERRLSEAQTGGDTPAAEFPTMHGALVQVADTLRTALFQPGRGVVLSAPALTVEGQFDYVRERLGLAQNAAPGYALPAERASQTLLYLPDDVPEPSMPQYQRHLTDALIALSAGLQGEVVVLFTSHAALRGAYVEVKPLLEQQDILVLAQGIDGSPRQLWQQYQAQPRVVLLGAGSFWDAVDMGGPGPACIVVSRLPLAPLSDPAMAARAERYQDQLHQFIIPQAALRLRQALNRLAWGTPRRNAVVLFDKRIQAKEYGQVFLNTLPDCTTHRGSVSLMPEHVSQWLAQRS